jgi:hypothetical protein
MGPPVEAARAAVEGAANPQIALLWDTDVHHIIAASLT